METTRKTKSALTPLELRIMRVLWEHGPSTVQTVQERLPGERLAYTTVQTMLNVLHRKGKAKRVLKGKAYVYQALLSRKKASRQAVGDLIDRLFGGSVEGLVMSLVQTRRLKPEKLEKLRALIEKQQKNRAGEAGEG